MGSRACARLNDRFPPSSLQWAILSWPTRDFRDPVQRPFHDDELQAKLYGWFGEHTKDEILAMSPRFKVPFGAVLTPGELLESPSLAERAFFDEVRLADGRTAVVPGRPFLGFPWTPPSLLHEAGADSAEVAADWLEVRT